MSDFRDLLGNPFDDLLSALKGDCSRGHKWSDWQRKTMEKVSRKRNSREVVDRKVVVVYERVCARCSKREVQE